MLRTNQASVALPLPVDPELAQIFTVIMAGGEGELAGCDLWQFLPQVGIMKMPVAKPRGPGFTYNAWVVYLKKEDGKVVAEEIRSAVRYSAAMIRTIVAYGETCDKHRGLEEDKLPTPMELAERL